MKKRSFFDRLTGGVRLEEDEAGSEYDRMGKMPPKDNWMEEEAEEAQLTVDVYQTPTDIIVQTMAAGVKPEDLQIEIGRDMITIKGRREENKTISEDNYFIQELYWGAFSRTILLPQEVEPEEAEAVEKHGLLIIKLPKIDKTKKANLKVKSL